MRWTIHPAFYGASASSIDLSPLARIANIAPAVFGVNAGAGQDLESTMTTQQMRDAVAAKIALGGYDGPRLAYWDFEGAYVETWGNDLYVQAQNACEAAGSTYTWGAYHSPQTDMNKTTTAEVQAAVGAVNDGLSPLVATCPIQTPDFYITTATAANALLAARHNMIEVKRVITGAPGTRIVPFLTAFNGVTAIEDDLFVATLQGLAEHGIREFILWGLIPDAGTATSYNAVFSDWGPPFFDTFNRPSTRHRVRGVRGR